MYHKDISSRPGRLCKFDYIYFGKLQHKYNLLHFFSLLCIYYLDCDSFGMTFALKLSTSFFANLDLLEAEINYLTNHVNNKHTDHGMPAKGMFFKQECKIGCHKARIGW